MKGSRDGAVEPVRHRQETLDLTLGITSKANLEKIRKVTAKRAFEAHDLLLRSYYAAKSSPSRTDFSDIVGNAFALQHRLRPSKSRSR